MCWLCCSLLMSCICVHSSYYICCCCLFVLVWVGWLLCLDVCFICAFCLGMGFCVLLFGVGLGLGLRFLCCFELFYLCLFWD